MKAIIRISGKVKIRKDVEGTLQRLGLKRKYSCVVFKEMTPVDEGMLLKVKDHVAYGEINEEILNKLVEKRGNLKEKDKKMKKYLFRLQPPRKGIDSKKHFGVQKGVLGNNKDKINELIERML
jgi:large subunit ribosomal protein L30